MTEYIANFTTINQVPNSKSFIIENENLLIVGYTVTFAKYNELVADLSSAMTLITNNNTDGENSDASNTDIYKLIIVQYKINPYAGDS